jgi:predicted RNA-binding Zn-ribbon protein involved in translation (DUF1610 family)
LPKPRYDQHKNEGVPIPTHTSPKAIRSATTGSIPGAGTFYCLDCGSHLSLLEGDALPNCPECGGAAFGRDSIFEPRQDRSRRASELYTPSHEGVPDWLEEAREMLSPAGRGLACRDEDGEIQAFEIGPGWTRIGRSAAADVRLDDPSVSRRHALIVYEPPKALRVLDDRSLNGIRLNGVRIEWSRLADGDELAIGRYRLFVLEG